MKKTAILSSSLLSIALLAVACAGGNDDVSEEPDPVEPIEQLSGTWEGEIEVPVQPLSISIHLDGDQASLSIPIQGLQEQPFDSVDISEDRLQLEMNLQGQSLLFEGERTEEKIEGTFTQMGQELPFYLLEKEFEDLVELEMEAGTMKAKVDMPDLDEPVPVALIIAGSGPTDKHGNSPLLPGRNDNLKLLAEGLNEAGIATIRYDKRGVGDNTQLVSNPEEVVFDDFIDDARAWIQYALTDERFSTVHIVGHSEGALIGKLVAKDIEVDSYTSLAGAGQTIDRILLDQISADPTFPLPLLNEAAAIFDQLRAGELVEEMSVELEPIFHVSSQPFLLSWMAYDPQEVIVSLDTNILLVNGTNDLQIPESEAELLHEANPDSKLFIVEGMGHALRETPEDAEGNVATASQPDTPLAEGLIEKVAEHILKD
ncbi:hydrolase [Bacillus sp. JCM 19046]|nr:hydrolase [Bacillus sp. JCM 19046]